MYLLIFQFNYVFISMQQHSRMLQTHIVVYMIKVSIFILLVYIYHLTCEEEHIEGTWSVCNVIQDIT